jgi:phosphatidate cytidylyltransferase
MYVGVLGGFAGILLSAPNGTGLIIGLAICAVGYDVVGFLVGSQFGRSKMAPRLSPNKTWEGLFGGMAAAVVLGGLVSKALSLAPWDGKLSHGLALGAVVAIMAPIGDLCESMIKRDLGVKDLGTILPGHGGILDRFDAILFCLPAVYYLVIQLEIG